MPELPEVETTRRGLEPLLCERWVRAVTVREARLRWPVAADLPARLAGLRIERVSRRAKYLLWHTTAGTCMVHLGMSGSLRVVPAVSALHIHDHVIWHLDDGLELRLRDPRRFGSVHWLEGEPGEHPLLRDLGPEPLGNEFHAGWLYARSRERQLAVKNFIMDAHQVVGVGNIYASEALFRAGITPGRAAGRVSLTRYQQLVDAIRAVLTEAIAAGGTTLRDFSHNDGKPGYFRQHLAVYGKAGQPCPRCGVAIRRSIVGQRSSYSCPGCQR